MPRRTGVAAVVTALEDGLAAGCFDVVAAVVPYVPTPRPVVEAMLDMAGVGADDFLIDLGSGDGRIAIMAAQRGARRGRPRRAA